MVGLLFCAENGGFADVVFRTDFRMFLVGFCRRSGSIEFFPTNGRFVDRAEMIVPRYHRYFALYFEKKFNTLLIF